MVREIGERNRIEECGQEKRLEIIFKFETWPLGSVFAMIITKQTKNSFTKKYPCKSYQKNVKMLNLLHIYMFFVIHLLL